MTDETTPLAVTVPQACRLSGYGPTTIWALMRDGRLRAIHVPGIRRTLVAYESLRDLLAPPIASVPPPRRRGRPRKSGLFPTAKQAANALLVKEPAHD